MEKTTVLDIWKGYFQEILNGEENIEESDSPAYLNLQPNIETPTVEEIFNTIKEKKNNKAPGSVLKY